MVKGNPWPQIRMKRRGEALHKQANKELIEITRQNMIKASKARTAERKAEQDSQIFYQWMRKTWRHNYGLPILGPNRQPQ